MPLPAMYRKRIPLLEETSVCLSENGHNDDCMITTTLTVSVLLVVLYVGAAIWTKRGLPDSISALVHDLPKGWKWVWAAWLALVTLTLAPALTDAMPEGWSSLIAYLCIICLAMTAAMPLVPGEHNTAHYALGIASGVLSQLCVVHISPWWLCIWSVMVVLIVDSVTYGLHKERWYERPIVLIIELLCSLVLFCALFTHILTS